MQARSATEKCILLSLEAVYNRARGILGGLCGNTVRQLDKRLTVYWKTEVSSRRKTNEAIIKISQSQNGTSKMNLPGNLGSFRAMEERVWTLTIQVQALWARKLDDLFVLFCGGWP